MVEYTAGRVRVGDFSGKVEGKVGLVGLVEVGWLVLGVRLQHAGKINHM